MSKSGHLGFEEELLKPIISRGKLNAYMHYDASKHIGDPDAYDSFVSWFIKAGG